MNREESKRDDIFDRRIEKIADFEFDASVAEVFDDMISRSVPLYKEVQECSAKICAMFAQKNSIILDCGCSTATTLLLCEKVLAETGSDLSGVTFLGVDSSEAMLEKAEAKISSIAEAPEDFSLILGDLKEWTPPAGVSVAFLNYTLQFLAEESRLSLLKRIREQLLPGGVVIISEKIMHSHPRINSALDALHLRFKRDNGYSELAVSQKRTALERVMKPVSTEENIQLLNRAGFSGVECFLKWYNFASFVATAD